MQAEEFIEPKIGINVRSDGNIDYAELIISGKKQLESRKSDSLRPYVGKRVAIVRTGSGKATAIGSVIIGEPFEVDEERFRQLEKFHLVPKNSKFDIQKDSTKFLYPMLKPIRFSKPKSVGKGIISRKIYDEGYPGTYEQEYGMFKSKGPERIIAMTYESEDLQEKWSEKYKRSINCKNPKGFSQRAHCQGKKKGK